MILIVKLRMQVITVFGIESLYIEQDVVRSSFKLSITGKRRCASCEIDPYIRAVVTCCAKLC